MEIWQLWLNAAQLHTDSNRHFRVAVATGGRCRDKARQLRAELGLLPIRLNFGIFQGNGTFPTDFHGALVFVYQIKIEEFEKITRKYCGSSKNLEFFFSSASSS